MRAAQGFLNTFDEKFRIGVVIFGEGVVAIRNSKTEND